ncbi:MAG: bifunctional UDP-N-acetylglucosamine diphosphorylase/glucosamine-1-phosphate N-acetyltransferase GlmU [Clostridiales bacterium]|nr:bifunctional UDP-N-acetylglucosamine diphosphorylase/glucosamine-1-phosphate N-acetyltransferase GlmU [Clostridiales bacterium]
MKVKSIILAAGQGTRMKSDIPKVLHKITGISLTEHVIRLSKKISDERPVVVIGHQAEIVKNSLTHLDVDFVVQEKQLGTGHAVRMAVDHIEKDSLVLILYGDTPLIKEKTINEFIEFHQEKNSDLSVLTMNISEPFGYGRVIIENDKLFKIVEEKDANESEKMVKEVNSGIYLMNSTLLLEHINDIRNKNKQNEFYLTDIVEIFNQQGYNVDAYCIQDYSEVLGINNRVQLAEAEKIMKKRINENMMLEGVTIIDPDNTYIELDVIIGKDTIVHPGSFLRGNTVIGENCEIGPRAVIESSIIESGTSVKESQILRSHIGFNTNVGPYAYVRPNSNIGNEVKIGDFVEVKNSNIGNGTKISHLTYVGDGDVGENVNLGCGVVFVNYDGINKNRTVIEDNSFVGCNVNLIAPVTVRENAYVAAGTTVTIEVPEYSLAIGREKQRNIEDWVKRKRMK